MSVKKYARPPQQIQEGWPECFRLEPEKRLTPRFDSCCIAEFDVAKPGKMGFRVVDDCCEDHIM